MWKNKFAPGGAPDKRMFGNEGTKFILVTLLLCIISIASFLIVKVGNADNLREDNFTVMTSFYPMYIAVLNITEGVEGVEVKNLTDNATGCLHDYQLSTKDLKVLDDADMLVVNGGGMENFLEDVFEQYSNLTVVTATDGLELLKEEDGYNAHSWMDVGLYMQEVEIIAEALMEKDSVHKTAYEDNLKKYREELQGLLEYAESINLSSLTSGNNIKSSEVVIFHEAFEYLENLCNFTIEEIVDMDENTSLSAAQMGNIIDLVNEGRIKYILADRDYGQAAAEAVQKECDVKVIYIDPLTTGEDNKDSYLNGMKENLRALKEAFAL